MKRFKIICLIISLAWNITAANYLPLLEQNKEWTCSLFMCNLIDPIEGERCSVNMMALRQGNDTVVNGQTYTIIHSNGQIRALLREDIDSQSIYLIPVSRHNNLYNQEFLFYRFDVNEGDTLVLFNNKDAFTNDIGSLTSNYIVDKISTINNRKVIELLSDDEYAIINHTKEIWVEGIGSLAGLLYRHSSTNELYTPWGIFDLLCVNQDGELIAEAAENLCQGSFHDKTVTPQTTCGCESTPVLLERQEKNQIHKIIKQNQLFICLPNGKSCNILGQYKPD